MTLSKTIQQIKNSILTPALSSYFYVEISPPTSEQFSNYFVANGVNYNTNQDKLNLLCSDAILPGSSLATIDINNDFTGVTERHAYRRLYDNKIDLTFYVDVGNYLPIRFFETWIKYIADESISSQRGASNNTNDTNNQTGVGSKFDNYFYRIRYPKDYTVDSLKVIKFERNYKTPVLKYEFVKSFPVSVNSIPISYDSNNLLKCTISMTYIRYIVLPPSYELNEPDDDNTNDLSKYPNSDLYSSYNETLTNNGIFTGDASIAGNSIGGVRSQA